ncbi:PaaI family thioesterase [Hyphomonas sp.]|uniref:PaaI family thioesterase n=1 Tax=Hyphomonas sp. TaxID=87 RepID=UPI00391C39E7
MTTRTELSAQQQAFFDRLRSGKWELPNGIRNLGIKPHEWLKDVSYGRTRYEWPNDGSRDIQPDRVFGGWVAGLSDHIVSMTMASALEEGEWFTTMELQTRILRPVPNGLITIEGRLVSRGKTTGLVEADWFDDKRRHLVRVTAAKAIRSMAELRPGGVS